MTDDAIMEERNTGFESSDDRIFLCLAGDSPRSRRARRNLAQLLDAPGREAGEHSEVDLLAHPWMALKYGIFATPALVRVREGAAPEVLYGDLSDTDRLRAFLS